MLTEESISPAHKNRPCDSAGMLMEKVDRRLGRHKEVSPQPPLWGGLCHAGLSSGFKAGNIHRAAV